MNLCIFLFECPERNACRSQASGIGKLLVFGGLTGSGRTNYIEDYLQGNLAGLTTLDDLW
jgi:hypothetical protein